MAHYYYKLVTVTQRLETTGQDRSWDIRVGCP